MTTSENQGEWGDGRSVRMSAVQPGPVVRAGDDPQDANLPDAGCTLD